MINLKAKQWEFNNVETVLLDKDGTFIDLHYFWGKMTEMRALNVMNAFNLSEDFFCVICRYLGYDIKTKKMLPDGITALYSRSKIIEIFRGNLMDLAVNTSERKIAEIFDKVSIDFYNEIEMYTKPISEAIEFIKKLRVLGVKVGVVTSDSIVSTNLIIKNQGWDGLFDVVIGRESSSETKESGIPTKLAMKSLNANPETTIMIGDAPMDYISASNAGIDKTILVATGQVDVEKLKEFSPYVLKSLKDLECWKI